MKTQKKPADYIKAYKSGLLTANELSEILRHLKEQTINQTK